MSCEWLFLLMIGCVQGGGMPEAGARDELRHIEVAYRANRAAFPFGAFRFDYIEGSAPSVEDARAGRLPHASTARGFYAFDGTNARFEIVHDTQEMERKTWKVGENRARSSLLSFRGLTDGRVALIDYMAFDKDERILKHMTQIGPVSEFLQLFEFPLSLGLPDDRRNNLAINIEQHLKGEIGLLAYEARRPFEGHEVAYIEFQAKGGTKAYWVDLERASIPLQVVEQVREGNQTIRRYYDDVRFEPGAGWLPRQSTVYLQGGKVVHRIVIHEVVLDKPPATSAFQLEFENAVGMRDQVNQRSYPPSKVWSLAHLPAPMPASGPPPQGRGYQPPEPTMPGEREPSRSGWMIALAVIGGVFLALAAFRIVRARAGGGH